MEYATVTYRVPKDSDNPSRDVEAYLVSDGEVIAFSRADGHFDARPNYYRMCTRPATPEEVCASGIVGVLAGIGYHLRPSDRVPWHRVSGWHA